MGASMLTGSSARALSVAIAAALLAACGGGGGSGSGGSGMGSAPTAPFALSGNLQTFTGIRGTTTASATSNAALAVTGDNISWTASSTVPWITLPTTSGTAAGTLAFTVNPSTLPIGPSEGTIRVTDSRSNVTLNATVSVTVRDPNLVVSPAELTFTLDVLTTGAQQSFTIADELTGQSAAGGFEWDVLSSSPHVLVAPAEGNTSTTTTVNVTLDDNVLNAAIGDFLNEPLSITASGAGAFSLIQRTVPVRTDVRLPRGHAVFPNIVEPGAATVTLVGRDFQDEDVATLRVNGTPPVSANRLSDREIQVNVNLAAGEYDFTFENALSLSRSVAHLTVAAQGTFGAGEIVPAAAGARQRLLFDSQRGVLYASSNLADQIQRYSWNGTAWQERTPIALDGVKDFDFSSDTRYLYAVTGAALYVVDLTAIAPTAAVLTIPSLNCAVSNYLRQVAAPSTGTVHSALPGPSCRRDIASVSSVSYDLLLDDLVLFPRDPYLNDDVIFLDGPTAARVSGDRRFVATETTLWDSQTGEFLYESLANGRQPLPVGAQDTSIDLHGTKVLFGGAFVLDNTGVTTCTTPSETVSVLSADGSRLYSYRHVNGGGGQIKILSTAPSGSPTAPTECVAAAAPIPVPQDLGIGGLDPFAGPMRSYSMTVSDDDRLLFLSGPNRILAIAVP